MHVIYLRSFLTDIKKIKDPALKQKIKAFILEIKDVENFSALMGVKKIKGYSSAYRARIGDYRLGVYKENGNIELARFVKRNDIYKVFPKK